ncbi:MAG TPA: LLM class flavin-dependent oxidoreductase [Acidimicrobiales bacterium]|nr:LLM class flavin-dependent oxidoreductase [Acidimicrobiales bacterium]
MISKALVSDADQGLRRARVDRMIELINATQALLRGTPVSHRGTNFTLANAVLADPRPVRDPIPLMVGGNGTRVLHFAAQHADVVGVTGLGRTLADGHRHEVDWSPSGSAASSRSSGRPSTRRGFVRSSRPWSNTSRSLTTPQPPRLD